MEINKDLIAASSNPIVLAILAEKDATTYTLPMSTRVRLANLRFDGYHGATAAERSLPRRFEVDLELEGDFDVPERSDRLTDAVDYAEVAGMVVAIGTGPAFHLLEALARRMVDALAERWPQVAVSLEVRKLDPPHCPGSPTCAAVRLRRAALRPA